MSWRAVSGSRSPGATRTSSIHCTACCHVAPCIPKCKLVNTRHGDFCENGWTNLPTGEMC